MDITIAPVGSTAGAPVGPTAVTVAPAGLTAVEGASVTPAHADACQWKASPPDLPIKAQPPDLPVKWKAPPEWFRSGVPPKGPPQHPHHFFIGDTTDVPASAPPHEQQPHDRVPADSDTTDVPASAPPHEQQPHDRVPAESKVVGQHIVPTKVPPPKSTFCEDIMKIKASLEMLHQKVDRLTLAVDRLANPDSYVDC